MRADDTIEICMTEVAEGDFATLYTDGTNEVWIPHSQIKGKTLLNNSTGRDYELVITRWIAFKKGLI